MNTTVGALRCGWLALAVGLVAWPVGATDLVPNGDFTDGVAPWVGSESLALEAGDGRLCTVVPRGSVNPWDAIVSLDGVALVAGESYLFSFSVSGDPGGSVRAVVQLGADPWTAYGSVAGAAVPEAQTRSVGFIAPETRQDVQIVFQVGGSWDRDWRLCLDDVALIGGVVLAPYQADTGPRVRVNQLGYLPDGPRRATIVTSAEEPLDWHLRDAAGAVVASGLSAPRGFDDSAGVAVHVADFSAVSAVGDGFTLSADGETSHPFAIRADLYDPLRIDALSYYYPVRSGVAIDGAIAGEAYARPAGHVSQAGGADPNQGDYGVPCQPPEISLRVYGEPWTCGYTLDVVGGWYDAGDHGKYVVNGGISVAQVMATYERARIRDGEALVALADGSLPVPEAGNGVPDILDEARWQLEWMLTMVVPAGDPLAGMVHHKIHDNEWTGLPLMPHLAPKTRELHRPSTAATLNLAAAAAQGARLFRPYDAAFADRLLAAAEAAYAAAQTHPDLFATPEDGASGGGPYDDTDVSDEFFWAAAELYLTTGDPAHLAAIKTSPHWADAGVTPYAFDWKHVAGFARLQLATVPSGLSAAALAAIRSTVTAGADALLAVQAGEPFGHPYAPDSGLYDWGSTHLVVQNALALATAHELTGDRQYRDGALEAMDYVLGRNALNISYITGYGTHFARNQHSRWFAAQLNPGLPHPPDGALAGGPNSSIQDPVAQRLFAGPGCAPQTCYIDDIESWATNEITINWNAALSQLASYLADQ